MPGALLARSARFVAALLLVLAVPLARSHAQGNTAIVEGRVTDASNQRPLENVQVTIDGTQLGAMAKKAGATVLLYVTWPRRDTPQTIGAIASTYAKLAQRIGATLVPVGPAWMAMREESPATELYIDDGSHPSPVGTYIAANVFYGVLYDKSPKGLPAQAFSVRGNRYVADTLPMALTPLTLTPMEAAAAQRAADRVLMSRSR
jgi:hypothetical protein